MESGRHALSHSIAHFFSILRSFIIKYSFILGSIVFIVFDVFTSVYSKRLIDYAPNYVFFLNQFNTLFFVFLYLFVYLFFIGFFPSIVKTRVSFYELIRISLMDSISGVFYNIGVVYTTGPRIVMLSQLSVPLTIVSSKVITNRKYHKLQYIGTSIITLSLVITQLLSENKNTNNKLFFNVVLLLSVTFDSVNMCFREEQYSIKHMNMPGYLFWTTFLYFAFNCITVVLYSFKFWGTGRMDLSYYIPTLVSSFKCIFKGVNTIVDECGGPDQRKCDDCTNVPRTFVPFIILVIFYRLILTLLMRNRSALVMILISIIKTPIVSFAFSMKSIAENSHTSLQLKDIISIICIIIGMIFYSIGTKLRDQETRVEPIPTELDDLLSMPSADYTSYNSIS